MNSILEWFQLQKFQPILVGGIAALITSIIAWRYRRKDLYNQLLKEQITAAYSVVNDLIALNVLFNDKYKEVVGTKFSEHLLAGMDMDEFNYDFYQTQLLLEAQPEYQTIFRQVTSKGFIFPQNLQKLMTDPFKKISDLFESDNNSELGIKLMSLWDDTGDLVDELNRYFKIDKLSRQMKRKL